MTASGDPKESCPGASVVVATYNRADILKRCLLALVEQTATDFEVLVVDDGSQDGTVPMLEALQQRFPRLGLRILQNPENLGSNRSRNRGIQAARGEFVAFLDSDCIAHPNWLESLLAGFTSEDIAAVTGLVENPPPQNLYELAYKGTNRVETAGEAKRLVAGNLAIRRELLLRHPLDEDLRWGCDEEGISLRLRSAGYRKRFEPAAVVLHDHPFDRRGFFRHASLRGKAAAWLVYKYHLPPRRDMVPFVLAYAALLLLLVDVRLVVVPLFFFGGAVAALAYAELWLKRKTVGEALRSFPALLAYYHVKLVAYVSTTLRLHLRPNRIQRIRL